MSDVVKSGDTLGANASRVDTTMHAILAANPQIKNANQIFVGVQIKIPNGSSTGQTAPTNSSGGTSAPSQSSPGAPPARAPGGS